jgi:cytochrome c oxidase subunit I+III
MPLMIGARDMAFPRVNALSFWLFLGAGIFIYVGLFLGYGPNAGWFDYVPLALRQYDPGLNVDFYSLGLIFVALSSTAASANMLVTIFKLRAPGMSLNRMPLFCFAQLAAAGALIFALPPLLVNLVFLELERKVGFHFFDVAHGGQPLLWQDLFWIFGHPEVYIIVLPSFGIATSIIPTFARRRMIAFPLVALAELLVAFIGFGVWAHHMFATGMPTTTIVFFAGASMAVVIPSTIQIFAWTITVTMGRPIFRAPLLFIGGFIAFFVIGGLSGIMFTAIPFDQATTDTYFVVAHFHFIIFGAAVFPLFGGMYYWFPKVTGRMYHEGWAQASFWVTAVGTFATFFPMHIVGLLGMTRRVYTYDAGLGWGIYNLIETIGGGILAVGILIIFLNLIVSARRGAPVGPDPFYGGTLEWTIPSPPPHYNFAVIPTVTSPYPNWDRPDRAEDQAQIDRGELTLAGGHETPASTVRDGFADEVLEMPPESPWPILVALAVSVGFVLLLTAHYVAASFFAGLVVLILAAWHAQEPLQGLVTRTAKPSGWWAMAIFVAGEATLFASLVGSYFFLRFNTPHWPPRGIPEPEIVAPLVLTAILIATSPIMHVASRAARAGRRRTAWWAILLALLVQSGYLAYQIHLYAGDLDKFQPQANAYASIYYVLVGADHAHVALGLLLDLWLLARLATGLTNYRAVGVQAAALYWHVVNALTVVCVLTELSPHL